MQTEAEYIKVGFTDIDGILRGKYVNAHKFQKVIEGHMGFCDVVFGWDSSDVTYEPGVEATGWHTGFPDAVFTIDPQTKRYIPWEADQEFYLGDFSRDEQFKSICPRSLLRSIEARSHNMGYIPKMAQEFEWFNFKGLSTDHDSLPPSPITKGMFGYSLLRLSMNHSFIRDLLHGLHGFDVPIEGIHTETGPGVVEACVVYDTATAAADKAILFKQGVKEIGHKHQISASFMAKWKRDLPGCSGHIHQSLWRDDKNVFAFDDAGKSSNIFQHYLAGQLYCLPHILPMFAPTVNSFKRLVPGSWAPTHVSWGYDNRTCAYRVIESTGASARLETRVSGSDTNPYLAIAASLAAGLYGIENKLPLDLDPVVGNAYDQENLTTLPTNLKEATVKMQESEVAEALFGSAFVDHFCKSRLWEWNQFQEAVTDWELNRYFEII